MKALVLHLTEKLKSWKLVRSIYSFMNRIHFSYSYSQRGEDLIIQKILKNKKMFYIDIGTNDPIMINNTYKLYRHGATGILVEPNPEFENRIRKKREKDIYLQMGIMPEGDGSLTYYEMSRDTLNTFSQQDAIDACKKGYRILKETKIPIISVKKFCDKYVKGKEVGVLSVDVEGYDFDIIRKWPYDEIRPVIICLETIEFTTGVKRKDYFDIIEFMRERGYMIYADTCINTLFVDSQRHLES